MTPAINNSSGVVRITCNGSFDNAAAMLGQIFGVVFERETKNTVENVQSWIARRGGLRYILRQAADPGHAMQENAAGNYEFSIKSTNSAGGVKQLEIVDYLVARIRRDGRLDCWPGECSAVARK